MIIICPQCLTKFNLDDGRVPEGGAKVRCSKCQHIFQVRQEPLDQPAPSVEIPPKELPGELEERSQRKGSAGSRFPAFTLLIALLLLTGIGYGAFVLWEKSADLRKLTINLPAFKQYLSLRDGGEGYVSVEKLRGYYLENAKSAKVFVIEGQAVNHWKESRSFIKVKGILLDSKGGKVAEKVAYCGNILSEKDLKELDPEAIEKSLSSQFGISFSNVNIPPDKFVPFMIAFADSVPKIPADKPSPEPASKPAEVLREPSDFIVEVVSSQKGSK
jgi:predicted Zn finger-like uncharacterized protein